MQKMCISKNRQLRKDLRRFHTDLKFDCSPTKRMAFGNLEPLSAGASTQPQSLHRGPGPLETLPASPEIVFLRGRGIDQMGFIHFVSDIARVVLLLVFRQD